MIKTLIFDFGNVFFNLNKEAALKKLSEFGLQQYSQELLEKNMSYEKGLLSTADFITFYQQKFPKTSQEYFVNAWNSVLSDFPQKRFDFIRDLATSQKFTLILLSNNNDLHTQWVKRNIPFFDDFIACFDKFYLSQEIKMRKPDKEIYQWVIDQNNLNPTETLFIDDLKENTKAAQELGFKVWNLNPETNDVTELFTVKKELF